MTSLYFPHHTTPITHRAVKHTDVSILMLFVEHPYFPVHQHPEEQVTVVHTGVADIGALTRQADVLVAAAGSPGMITADMVKPGAAVVAAGVSFEGKKLVSDVADEVAEVAGWLSPRIGGVGPMTRAMLMVNTVEAAERRAAGG